MARINPGSGIAGASIGQTLQNRGADNPIVYSQDIQGGLTNVENAAARLAISPRRLQPGMIVHDEDDGNYYRFLYTDSDGTALTLSNSGDFNYGTPPTLPARTIPESWQLIAFNAAEPAILDTAGVPTLATGIDAQEIRSLIGVSAQGVILNYQLTQAAGVFTMGTWSGSTTGVLMHPEITSNAIVFLNGTLLQETTDYVIDDAANTITLVSRIRGAIVDANAWCITVVDEIDDTTAGTGTGRVVNVITPRGSLTLSQADLDTVDATATIDNRPIVVDSTTVATVDVSAVLVTPGIFRLTVTIDTTGNWTFTSATLGGANLPFDIVTGMDHEWTASFLSSAINGPLIINVADLTVDTGVFYQDSTSGVDTRLSNIPPTIGQIENLGFQTSTDSDDLYQPIETTGNEYVRTPDLANYVTTTSLGTILPVTVTRGDTFPTDPEDGDQHFLTTNIYPTGTTFTPTVRTERETGTGVQTLMEHTTTDPVTALTVVVGTTLVSQANVPIETQSERIVPAGPTTVFSRGFTRDRSYDGFHITRSNVVGSTTHTTTVSENRYGNVTVNLTDNPTVVGALLYDYYYRVHTTNIGGGSILAEVHYIAIDLGGGAVVNPLLTEANAISEIERLIQDQSALDIQLVQGSALPIQFPTTSNFTSRNLTLRGMLGTLQEQSTYQFTPMNGFALNTTRTTIGGATTVARIIGPDGTIDTSPQPIITDGVVNIVVNAAATNWAAEFTRSYPNVPSASTTPDASAGQYFHQGSWRAITSTPVSFT